jgi:hypothetical protein
MFRPVTVSAQRGVKQVGGLCHGNPDGQQMSPIGFGITPFSYARHRFPPDVIRHAVWLYLRFTLSYRDVEELLAERGPEASYETARRRF